MSLVAQTVAADEAGLRLDRWLRRRYPDLTQGRIEKMLRSGQIRVDGARAKSNARLEAGQQIRVPPIAATPKDTEAKAEVAYTVSDKDAAFVRDLMIYEDNDLIALNKPAGLAVQGGSGQSRHLDGMLPALARRGETPPRLVHRLDRDTSGVIVVAKNARSAADLAKQFKSRETKKTYWAIVLGVPRPASGEISGFLRKGAGGAEGREQMELASHGDDDAKHARTLYTVVDSAGQRVSWVALRPVTGRTHQLRVHMAEIGHAIAGDRKYTCDRETPGGLEGKLQLHARELVLQRPGGKMLSFTAPPPPHMKQAFTDLGFSESSARGDLFAGLED